MVLIVSCEQRARIRSTTMIVVPPNNNKCIIKVGQLCQQRTETLPTALHHQSCTQSGMCKTSPKQRVLLSVGDQPSSGDFQESFSRV
jgi:hypothetical protein